MPLFAFHTTLSMVTEIVAGEDVGRRGEKENRRIGESGKTPSILLYAFPPVTYTVILLNHPIYLCPKQL